MSSGEGGTNVDNLGAGAGAQEEESDHQTVVVTNSRCTMEYEGPKGQEALKKVTLKNGDVKHYWGEKGAERFHRIDKADGSIEGYKGTPSNQWLMEHIMPNQRTVLYGGGGNTTYMALALSHVHREACFFKRTGEGATTSSLVRKMDGFGKFFARRSEEDEWEEVEVSDEWLEGMARARQEARQEAARKRARAEQEERERKRRRELEAEREKRARNADASINGGFKASDGLGVKGEDKAPEGNAESYVEKFKDHDQANC